MHLVVNPRVVSVVVWALLAAGCGSSPQAPHPDATPIDRDPETRSDATATGGSTTSASGGASASGDASAAGGTSASGGASAAGGTGGTRDAGTGGSVNEGVDASADANNGDAGTPDLGPFDGEGTANDADPVKLWGLSAGENCFTIASIEPGSSDGCNLGVATFVGLSLPMTYTATSGSVALGVSGSLGTGAVRNNKGTLLSDRDASATSGNVVCKYHQNDTTQFELIADNTFIARITEVESMFGTNCGSMIPTGGTCTSMWTWTMQRLPGTSLSPPNCGNF